MELELVLVTGATGFLGGALISALLASGRYRVRALSRKAGVSLGQDVEVVIGDVLDPDSLLAACRGCAGVFHAAACVKSWSPDPALFYEVNVTGFSNVLDAVKRTSSIRTLVYTSSFFVLGPSGLGRIGDENQTHSGKSFCTEYEKSKLQADHLARQAAKAGVPIVLLYPGVIYGPGKLTRGNIIADLLIERFNGRLPGYIGYGRDRFSFSYIDDVAQGHVAAFEKGLAGQRYILGGENASLKDVFNIAAAATGTSRPWFHIPLWLVYVYGYLSAMVARISGIEPVVTHPAAAVIRYQWAFSSSKAQQELGYQWRPLRLGIPEVIRALEAEGRIKL